MSRTISRFLNFLDFALWKLKKNKIKNLLIYAIYTFNIFLLSSVLLFNSSINMEAKEILQHAPDIVVQKIVAGRHELIDKSYVKAIENIKGITSIKLRLWGYYYEPNSKANFTILSSDDKKIIEGNVIIGKGVSKILKKTKDDLIPLFNPFKEVILFNVFDELNFDTPLLTNDLIIMNEKDFRKISGVPDNKFTDIAVYVKNEKEIDKISEKIFNAIPNSRIITKKNILKTYDTLFNWRSSLVMLLLMIIFISFIIISLDRIFSLNTDDTYEIGILKALGWDTTDIIIVKNLETVLISIFSFLLGWTMAYFHVYYTDLFFFKPLIKGWAILYPEFKLTPAFNISILITVFSVSVIPFILTSIFAIWKASIIEPDIAMR